MSGDPELDCCLKPQCMCVVVVVLSSPEDIPNVLIRDVNGIIKNSLKMPGSRGHIGPGGVKRQRLVGGWEKLNFHTSTA